MDKIELDIQIIKKIVNSADDKNIMFMSRPLRIKIKVNWFLNLYPDIYLLLLTNDLTANDYVILYKKYLSW